MQLNLPGLKQAMKDQFEKNNIIANNLANITTIGFKKDAIFFNVLEGEVDGDRGVEQVTDFSQGHLEETNNPLDLAVKENGFFTIDTENGIAYTREGHFKLDQDGILRTSAGHAVMGKGGWISLNLDHYEPGDIIVTQKGEILVNDELMGELLITDFENPGSLRKSGSNLFTVTQDSVAVELDEPVVEQGFLERSNVNPAQEMIELIDIQRQFESVHKMVRTMDDIFSSAVNQVGKY